MDHSKLIPVEQHFRSNDHDFNRDAKFTIIERIEKDINIKSVIEKQENKWINKIKSYNPFGLNIKRNGPS